MASSSLAAQTKNSPPRKRTPSAQQSQAQPPAAAAELARRATQARESGQLNEAIPLYLNALRANPSWTEGWWYLGAMLYDRDRYAEAVEAFRRLVALEPRNGPAWTMLGLCEFQTRDYQRAVIDIQRGRMLGIGNNQELTSVARYHAAILMIRFEQFEVAYEILREFAREQNEGPKIIEAFGLDILRMPFLPAEAPPDKRELVLMAGRAAYYMAARRPAESRQVFDQLLARYPDAPNVHYAFGVFLLNSEPDAAIEEFKQELKLSPSHAAAMLQIAFEYLKRGDYAAGLPFAEKAVGIAPRLFPGRNALGRILLEMGQVDRAIKELEEGVKLAPESPEMHFALARAYSRAGRKDDAARERALFTRLDKEMRTQREGSQSVGGVEAKPEEKRPR
jgi:tetratricopeptide (TPR) repeat protein